MHCLSQAAALVSISLFSGINASPVLPRAVDCYANSASAVCWEQLDMTSYMNYEFAKSGSCKLGQKSWSKCFLDFAAIKPAMDCSDLQSTTCKKPTMDSNAKAFYGAWNIWSTWSYISSWATGIDAIVAKDPEFLKGIAQPDQWLTQDPIQNIDVALTTMISWTDKFDKAPNDAFITFIKANPSVHIYDANRSSGVNIGNQLQQRLAELLQKLSTDLPSFIKLVKGGSFSRNLLYNEQSIEDRFMPQFASQADTDPVAQEGSVTAGNSTTASSGDVHHSPDTASWDIHVSD